MEDQKTRRRNPNREHVNPFWNSGLEVKLRRLVSGAETMDPCDLLDGTVDLYKARIKTIETLNDKALQDLEKVVSPWLKCTNSTKVLVIVSQHIEGDGGWKTMRPNRLDRQVYLPTPKSQPLVYALFSLGRHIYHCLFWLPQTINHTLRSIDVNSNSDWLLL
ncbi:unnamed protein product [Lactuca saligna]|uniref:Uncharacterized protein n=1 Tax=Lactuca saligna TaxID=75948 RepID=A0AA35YGN9_LACSI|nr:unnamed protein product [Lactuca saligna]